MFNMRRSYVKSNGALLFGIVMTSIVLAIFSLAGLFGANQLLAKYVDLHIYDLYLVVNPIWILLFFVLIISTFLLLIFKIFSTSNKVINIALLATTTLLVIGFLCLIFQLDII